MASRATFAFNSALYRFLCPVIFSSLTDILLNTAILSYATVRNLGTSIEDDIEPQIIDFSKTGKAETFAGFAPQPFPPAVIAVDSGVIDLGELASGGTVFAIRGAAICYPPKNEQPFVCLYNTGALLIDHQNKFPIFHYIGTRLGKEDLFVKLSDLPPYYRPKQAMGDTPNQIQDRCRNFVERMI